MRALHRQVLLAALLASACRSRDTFVPATNDVARGVEFTEYDGDTAYLISRPDSGPRKGQKLVPSPVEVDVNSTLALTLHKNELVREEVGDDVFERAQAVVDRTLRVRAMLAWLEDANDLLLASIAEADDLLRLPFDERQRPNVKKRLDRLIQRTANTERKLLDDLDALFPEDSEAGERIDAALEEGMTGVLGAVSAEANEELARLAHEYQVFELRFVEARTGKRLRIEAFLLRDGDTKPVAVHVPGYDELAAGNVRTIDRLGLRLSDEERERLAEGVEASKELAHAANRVRRKQATVAEALADLQTETGRKIGELATEIDAMIAKLEDDGWEDRFEGLVGDLRSQADELAGDIRATAAAKADELAALPGGLLDGLQAELVDPSAQALLLFQRAKELVDRFGEVEVEGVTEFVTGVRGWVEDARAFVEGPLADAFETTATRLGEVDDRVLAILTEDLDELPEEVVARWKESPARAELIAIRRDANQLLRLLDGLVRVLTGAGVRADQPLVRDVRGLDVDLEQAPDTSLNLRRVSREEGDELLVKTTLLQGDQELEESEASFLMTRYGWHASIEPSVVLVEADRLAGADDSGGFSPAVAWMHSYKPRPEDDGFFNATQRAIDASIGLHAAFLNYDPDNDPEFGLGVSLSFWKQRVQIGYGYNLMADDRDEGQYYAYIGSSLFALLNDVQEMSSDD